ncbi:MAG: Asp-tRNA(Asn)/Glu-tRNA(Gln) amidotransferase subunit GatB [Lachnospiraceae bacterium]|nr:Asp-tRNA(Asn)/Glu-tRNA(Gln) amidotransferase subunit GatB [Lachnospiraceae bacterium]
MESKNVEKTAPVKGRPKTAECRRYDTVIGLEVHIELSTKTKIFCGCSTKFGALPNTQTCPVCTGMPGSLPVLNKKVVEYAIALGLATNCRINQRTLFDRKNYFYPDNPQDYQISQLYEPICLDGYLEIAQDEGEKRGSSTASENKTGGGTSTVCKKATKTIRIHEMHMEEDAGKLTHDESEGISLVDYNRSGVPLIEIVSEPDMETAEEVIAYLEKLRMICLYLGISDCKLQEGSMRVDVNLSVKEAGSDILGTRTEMKNLNSFKAITRAIAAERERQIALLESGEKVEQETRRWDDTAGASYSMRSKEDSKDYRYFPEPDVMPVVISDAWIEEIKQRQPEFKEEKAARFEREYGIPAYDADILTQSRHLASLFEETATLSGQPKKTANWFMGELFRIIKETGKEPEEFTFSPKHAADLIVAVEEGKINQAGAKEVFAKVVLEDIEPLSYMEQHGLMSLSDEGALQAAIEEVIAENGAIVEEYRSGKDKVFGFLVGQVMKKTKGKADPGKVNELLKRNL